MLIGRMRQSGQAVPVNSRKHVGWHSPEYLWRVQLPAVCGSRQEYFSPTTYGGVEEALVEALLFRDQAFASAGLEPPNAASPTHSQQARGVTLPISESIDPRRGALYISGSWMETIHGKTRQRRVSRSVEKYGYAQARAEVETLVRKGLEREAHRFLLW